MAERAGTTRRRRFTVDSLFADTRPQAVGVRDLVEAKEIELHRIEPDPEQPRRTFDPEKLQELADSIRLEGVIQPIVVRYDEERDVYVIVHGERRWRASKMVQLERIPALVREVPKERRLIQQLMENIVRDDLNALDRAAALRALKAQLDDAPWEQVAEAVGIRRSRLFQLLGTEKLPEAAQADIREGRLSEKQSRALQGLPPAAQEALRQAIVEEGISATEASKLARVLRGQQLPDDPAEVSEIIAQARAELAHRPGTAERDPARQDGKAPTDTGKSAAATKPDAAPRAGAWRDQLRTLAKSAPSRPLFYDEGRLKASIASLAHEVLLAPSDSLRPGNPLHEQLVALITALRSATE